MAFIALLPVLSEKSWIPKKTKNTADDNKCTLKFILSCFEISVWTLFLRRDSFATNREFILIVSRKCAECFNGLERTERKV